MKISNSEKASEQFGRMADDFFLTLIRVKFQDYENSSLPFIYAHLLELSSKAACLKLNLDFSGLNHSIYKIFTLIGTKHPEILGLLPPQSSFNEYKKMFVRSDAGHNTVTLPPPDQDYLIHQWEMAYIMDNVMNLKYGFTRDWVMLSNVMIAYEGFNDLFLPLFKATRKIYSTPFLDENFVYRMVKGFGNNENTTAWINLVLDV
ncbi:hypothetical protein [Dyadobacter sp. CY347]|uniref:hypothetical protein n=1 Tax=Dyadobacter sp. CY347 TaxID=2909336 RepID=UPI001F3BE701|nr:hypothetical protein [Dyadobacter sp. CY347]MCF2487501.1 hypothetical protein [Dyadobacter sp. CY347]